MTSIIRSFQEIQNLRIMDIIEPENRISGTFGLKLSDIVYTCPLETNARLLDQASLSFGYGRFKRGYFEQLLFILHIY